MAAEPDVKVASADFVANFKTDVNAIESALAKPDADRPAILSRVSELSKSLTAAAVYLPGYDQRQCNQLLKGIQDKLASAPRPKFAFSARKSQKQASNITAEVKPSVPANTPQDFAQDATLARHPHSAEGLNATPLDPQEGRKHTAVPANPSTSRTLSDYNSRYISLPFQPMNVQSSGLTASPKDYHILSSQSTVISLLPHPISTLHIKSLTSCIVITGPINGSVFIEDCVNCVLVVACHQFRMHKTTRTDIYLHTPTHPIIEDCHGIRFASYPYRELQEALTATVLDDLFQAASLKSDENRYQEVNDFKWLRKTASPNWTLLTEKEAKRGWNKWIAPAAQTDDEVVDPADELENNLSKFLPTADEKSQT
ncbi:tubulin binding cofactor C-domain-containing protein [Gaertneriomyces semiglobifer]|nr:tubulin binding cofactor C-domain-containing protein [Gaertneriomyces semiglobifer]